MRFAFIQQRKEQYPIELMCRILEVSRSGYYAWLNRKDQEPGPRARKKEELVKKIAEVFQESDQVYGSPRVYQALKAQGQQVCENTVAKLMKEQGLCSVVRRRFKVRTTDSSHAYPVSPNRLERCFEQALPNRAWCADITYVPTDEGWLYVAAVIDLCSRKIVGWSMADHLRAELCTEALTMAVAQRRPGEGLVHHSDRGVQYACREYRQLLDEYKMHSSMSGKGDCYDNAVMESFFKTLKSECVYQRSFASRQEAKSAIFRYIEVFYNRKRLHSSLGYMSPEQFEAALN